MCRCPSINNPVGLEMSREVAPGVKMVAWGEGYPKQESLLNLDLDSFYASILSKYYCGYNLKKEANFSISLLCQK